MCMCLERQKKENEKNGNKESKGHNEMLIYFIIKVYRAQFKYANLTELVLVVCIPYKW